MVCIVVSSVAGCAPAVTIKASGSTKCETNMVLNLSRAMTECLPSALSRPSRLACDAQRQYAVLPVVVLDFDDRGLRASQAEGPRLGRDPGRDTRRRQRDYRCGGRRGRAPHVGGR